MSRFSAARSVFCVLNPKTVLRISPAMKKKVHPASLISFSNVERVFLTDAHPFEQDSLWSNREFGRCVPSSIKMLPAVIAPVIVCLIDPRCQCTEPGVAPAVWASHSTGWLRMLPSRSVISAHLTSSLGRRKTPRVPWYVPLASTTSSPSRNTGAADPVLIMFVYLLRSACSRVWPSYSWFGHRVKRVTRRREGHLPVPRLAARRPERQAKSPAPPTAYLAAADVPISVPITSPEVTSSTRRFCCRPSAVSLEATG